MLFFAVHLMIYFLLVNLLAGLLILIIRRIRFFRTSDVRTRIKRALLIVLPITAVSAVLLCFLAFFPVEKLFIRFDNAEQSIRYSADTLVSPSHLFDKPTVSVTETDKAAFGLYARGRDFHYVTVTRCGDQYGFCNADAQILRREFILPFSQRNKPCFFELTALKNKSSGETACYISIMSYRPGGLEDVIIYDNNQKEAEVVFEDEAFKVYALLSDGPENEFYYYIGKTRYPVIE